jgi:hypothetical protein
LGEDPIGFDSKDFNFYRYVSSSPINFTDPSGKFVCGGLCLGVATVIGGLIVGLVNQHFNGGGARAIVEPFLFTCGAIGIAVATPTGGPIWIPLVAEAASLGLSGVSAASSAADGN